MRTLTRRVLIRYPRGSSGQGFKLRNVCCFRALLKKLFCHGVQRSLSRLFPPRVQTAVSEAGAQVAAAAGGATQADFSNLLAEVAKHQGAGASSTVMRNYDAILSKPCCRPYVPKYKEQP